VIIAKTTEIASPSNNKFPSPNWYNLMGQPVDEDYKGIAVSRGKKILKR
jgi:hypothetical protein